MKRRRLTLAFLMYVTLDLSNPFVPGAFNFDPDECVEGVHRGSSSLQRTDAAALPVRVPVVRLELPPPSAVRPSSGSQRALHEWRVDAREADRASTDPPPPGEDH